MGFESQKQKTVEAAVQYTDGQCYCVERVGNKKRILDAHKKKSQRGDLGAAAEGIAEGGRKGKGEEKEEGKHNIHTDPRMIPSQRRMKTEVRKKRHGASLSEWK